MLNACVIAMSSWVRESPYKLRGLIWCYTNTTDTAIQHSQVTQKE